MFGSMSLVPGAGGPAFSNGSLNQVALQVRNLTKQQISAETKMKAQQAVIEQLEKEKDKLDIVRTQYAFICATCRHNSSQTAYVLVIPCVG